MRETTLWTLAAALVLGLGAAPQPAGAGVCKDLGKQCVVRRDIKKNAVNSGRVKDESLSGKDFKDGSLTGADVEDGSIGSADITDGSITSAHLAADAITADDIFARTLLVSPAGDGSDATANGQELLDAIAFLGSLSPAPGASNPWTLKLEPGIYDGGTSSVDLPPYVDLVGTGQGVTTITGNVDGLVPNGPAVVNMTDNTALRDVTVTNSGGGAVSFAYAIKVQGGPIRVADVTAQTSNALNSGIAINAPSGCGNLTLTNVAATAGVTSGDSVGADLRCTATVASNLRATGDDRGLASVGTTFVRDSVLEGTTASAERGGGTLNIAHSQLIGPISGTAACFGAYNQALAALNATCN